MYSPRSAKQRGAATKNHGISLPGQRVEGLPASEYLNQLIAHGVLSAYPQLYSTRNAQRSRGRPRREHQRDEQAARRAATDAPPRPARRRSLRPRRRRRSAPARTAAAPAATSSAPPPRTPSVSAAPTAPIRLSIGVPEQQRCSRTSSASALEIELQARAAARPAPAADPVTSQCAGDLGQHQHAQRLRRQRICSSVPSA